MAFDVMITGLAKTGETLLELNPVPWWDSDTLMEDDWFTVSNETGSYADFDADLNLEAMRELHEYFRPAATSGVYEGPEWQESIAPMVEQLDTALYEVSGKYYRFHVLCYEWETGL